MINLIPYNEKVRLVSAYQKRFAAVFLCFTAATLFIGTILLIPTYRLAMEKTTEINKSIKIAQTLSASRAEGNPEFAVKEVQKKLDLFASQKKKAAWTQLVASIVADRPEGMQLSGFTYLAGKRSIEIRGRASDRDALLDFVRALEKEIAFEKVTVPVSSFVKERDLDFSIEIMVKAVKS